MEKSSLTEGEKELYKLIEGNYIEEFYDSLKEVHFLGTYRVVDHDLLNPVASGYVHELLDALQEILVERRFKKEVESK